MRLLAAIVLFAQLVPAAEPTSLIADALTCADPTSATAHHVHGQGRVAEEHLATEMGAFRRTYDVQTVAGTGSRLEFTLTRPAQASSLILEVQEIHQRRPQAFGYTVAVNGTDVYFRTYEDLGAGPNHYFVQIPTSIASDRPLSMTVAEFGARAYEDSSRVDFAVSTDDGATWTPCGCFDNTWQNCYPQSMDNFAWKNPPQFIDLSKAVAGKRGFLLKMSLFVSPADERYCVSMLRVVSE